MSKLSDKIAEVGTSAEEAIARLEQQVASGGSSQADMDALDAIKAKLDASGRAEPSPPSGPTEPAGPTDPPVGEPVTEPVVDTSGSGEAVITPSVPPAA